MWEFWRSKLAKKDSLSPRYSGTGSPLSPDQETMSRKPSGRINFKDLHISADDFESDEEEDGFDAGTSGGGAGGSSSGGPAADAADKMQMMRTMSSRKGAERSKLIIILVGLPGRGKTFLCNKLKCYLNWLGHSTRHFNVGNYRRMQKVDSERQDATFFDSHNEAGVEARERALQAALDELLAYLYSEKGQVAIFDATNSTEDRRQFLANKFHGHHQYLFIESICEDEAVLERNYRYKMMYSPDYAGIDTEVALQDFKARVRMYEAIYEPITNRNQHYIKLIDMVTGRGHMDVNRISGYIPGKIVFFLMQVCKAGMAQARKIWLTRHGESEYNLAERIGGDSGLSFRGQEYSLKLPDVLMERLPLTFEDAPVPVSVWTSTLKRTIQTANYLPFAKLRWKALDEIHAGSCDGLTYADIAKDMPEDYAARKLDKLRYRYPAGESYLDVIQRLEPVITEIEREKECVCIVAHQAVLRAIYGYFMAVPLDEIPRLTVPLHTLIELRPRPDGTMEEDRFPVPISQQGVNLLQPSTSNPAPRHPGGQLRPREHMHLVNPNPPVQVPLGSSPVGTMDTLTPPAAARSPRVLPFLPRGSLHIPGPRSSASALHPTSGSEGALTAGNGSSSSGLGFFRGHVSRHSTGDLKRVPPPLHPEGSPPNGPAGQWEGAPATGGSPDKGHARHASMG